jgi:hypothetical protein
MARRIGNPLSGFWAGLTGRERTLILALVMVAFLMATVVLLFLRGSRTRETRKQIQAMEQALGTLHTRGAVYQEQLAEKKKREGRISSETLLFSTLLEGADDKVEDVTVTNMEEEPPVPLSTGLRKRVVKFDLRSVSLDALTRFLAIVESEPGHIILTNRLQIRSPSQTEDRLNVEVEIATWEREAEAAEEEVEE